MIVKTKIINDTLYIVLIGELDESTAGYTRTIMDESIKNNTYSNVVFELEDLEFMDSTGIGVLIGRYKLLKKMDKSTYISNPSSTIEKIFKMSGIYEIMPKIS